MDKATTMVMVAAIGLAAAMALVGCGGGGESAAPPAQATEGGEHGGHGTATTTETVSGAAGTAQTTCPAMGNPINRSLFVDHNGKRIYVCCQSCVGKVKEDPETYVSKLTGQGIVLEDAPAE